MKKLSLLAFLTAFLITTSSKADEIFNLIFDHFEVAADHTESEHYDLIFKKCSVSNFFGDQDEYSLDTLIDAYYPGKKYNAPFNNRVIASFQSIDKKNNEGQYLYFNPRENVLFAEDACTFRARQSYWSDPKEVSIASCMQKFRTDKTIPSCEIKYENKEVGTVTFFLKITRTNTQTQTAAKKTNIAAGSPTNTTLKR